MELLQANGARHDRRNANQRQAGVEGQRSRRPGNRLHLPPGRSAERWSEPLPQDLRHRTEIADKLEAQAVEGSTSIRTNKPAVFLRWCFQAFPSPIAAGFLRVLCSDVDAGCHTLVTYCPAQRTCSVEAHLPARANIHTRRRRKRQLRRSEIRFVREFEHM